MSCHIRCIWLGKKLAATGLAQTDPCLSPEQFCFTCRVFGGPINGLPDHRIAANEFVAQAYRFPPIREEPGSLCMRGSSARICLASSRAW